MSSAGLEVVLSQRAVRPSFSLFGIFESFLISSYAVPWFSSPNTNLGKGHLSARLSSATPLFHIFGQAASFSRPQFTYL